MIGQMRRSARASSVGLMSNASTNDAHLVIAVNLKPVNQGWHNINFGGA